MIKGNMTKMKRLNLKQEDIWQLTKTPEEMIKTTNGDWAMAVVLPRNIKTPIDFLSDLKDYDYKSTTIYKKMELCEAIYQYEGTVGDATDVLQEFCTTSGYFTLVKNRDLQAILKWWELNVNKFNSNMQPGIDCFNQETIQEFFTSGNSFPFRVWKDIPIDTLKNKKYSVPIDMYNLNPQCIEIPPASTISNNKKIYYNINRFMSQGNYYNIVTDTDAYNDLPSELRENIDGEGRVGLDNDLVTHIKRKSKNYNVWGIPYLTRTFSAVSSKRKLRQLDDATIQGLVNYLTIIKVGDKDHEPNGGHVSAIKSLLANPTPSMTVCLPYYVDVIQVGADGQVLSFADKYKDADREITRALGIPQILLDGTSMGSSGDQWVGILALIERLEQTRRNQATFLNMIGRQIAVNNNFINEYPVWKWNKMNLRNDKDIKNLILSFYDRGLLGYESALEEAGYAFNIQKDRREQENTSKLWNIFKVPMLPFSTKQTMNNDKNNPNNKIQEQSNPQSDNGRPSEDSVQPEKTIKSVDTIKADNQLFISALEEQLLIPWNDMKDELIKKSEDKEKIITLDDIGLIVAWNFTKIDRILHNAINILWENSIDIDNPDIDKDDFIDKVNGDIQKLDFNSYRDRLQMWNDEYLHGFMQDMTQWLSDIVKVEDTLIATLFTGVFAQRQNRLLMYPTNTVMTVSRLAEVYNKARAGYNYAIWRTQNDKKVCEICQARAGKIFRISQNANLDKIMAMCEPHPIDYAKYPDGRCKFVYENQHGNFEYQIDLKNLNVEEQLNVE